MEYQDEVERMRARRQHKGQPQTRKSSLKELEIIEFDDLERQRSSHRSLERQPKGPKSLEPTLHYARDERSEAIARQVRAERKKESMVRQAAEESRRKRVKRKRRIIVFELLLLCVLLGGIFFYFRKGTGSKYWTVAVFGVDSRDGGLEKDNHSDVQMICVLNRETGEIRIVSVFRDTYLQVSEEGKYHKANQAYFDGGHKQAVEALERNLDLKIDDYATFNWKAVADAITILGGIDLEISESEFAYINGFITETVNSTGLGSYQLEHPGMQHLDGVQAVAYARLRLMDTDYHRTARQRLVISLAMEKAKQADLSTLTTVLNTVLPQISTSVGISDLLPLAKNVEKFHIGENGGFPFSRGETYIGKKDCVIPLTLESNVIQLHQFLYEDMEYQPSSTVKKISAQIAADSGMGDVAENAPEARAGKSGSSSPGQSSKTQPPASEAPAETAEAVPEVSTEPVQEETLPEGASAEETEDSSDGEESGESESSGESSVESSQESVETGPGIGPGEGGSSPKPTGPGYESGDSGEQPKSPEDDLQKPTDPGEHTEPIGPGNPGPSSEN